MTAVVQHFDLSSPDEEMAEINAASERLRQGKDLEESELRSYAKYLGVKENEYAVFGKSLAQEGLSAPLPKGWEEGRTPEKGKRRFYYDSRTKRSQWAHPLDGLYKDKVKAAREAQRTSRPKVLGDVTNSKRSKGRTGSGGKGKERKVLPPLRLASIDVDTRQHLEDDELSQQNPLYKERQVFSKEFGDSESDVSLSTTTSSNSDLSWRKATAATSKRRKSKGSKTSPRESRMREVSDRSGRSTPAMDSDSNLTTSVSTRSILNSSSRSKRGRALAAIELNKHSASPPSLSPRTPKGSKKKGSPRRIERLNGGATLSPLPAPGGYAVPGSELSHTPKKEAAFDPLQLRLVIDVDEERATKEDIDGLRKLQANAFDGLKKQVGEALEKCVAAMGTKVLEETRKTQSSAEELGSSKRVEEKGGKIVTSEAQANLLTQLKGEIDMMSDLMGKEEAAKTLLVSQVDKFKSNLENERRYSKRLSESLEAAKEEGRKEKVELKSVVETQRQEIESLISRVSELSREKFQMAENFNSTVAGQKDEILRQLNKLMDKSKKQDVLPDAKPVLPEQHGSFDAVAKELEEFRNSVTAQLAEKDRELSQLVRAQGGQSDEIVQMLGEITSAVRIVSTSIEAGKGDASERENSAVKEMGKEIIESVSDIVGSHQNVAESLQKILEGRFESVSACITDGLAEIGNNLERKSAEHAESLSRIGGRCDFMNSEQAKEHQSLCESLGAISNKISAVEESVLKQDVYVTKEDLKEEMKVTFDKFSEVLLEQQLDLLSKTMEKQNMERVVLRSEGCQTEDAAAKEKRKIETKVVESDREESSSRAKSPVFACSKHSKKELALLTQAVEKAKANKRVIRMLTKRKSQRRGSRDSVLHNFEAYLNGLQASTRFTKEIYNSLRQP
ncbi:WW domain-containing protein [Chloropicon primus]|nr:WW domain-containing protein [Chloropicon primus]